MSWSGALLVYAAIRTVRPLVSEEGTPTLLAVLAEVGLHVLAVDSTGWWDSPFVFLLLTAIIAAGFARGFGFALRIACASAAAVALPYHLSAADPQVRDTAQLAAILVLVGIVSGYARYVFGEAQLAHRTALGRLAQLTEANTLLSELHQVAQTLPASLDSDEVLESALDQAQEMVDAQVVAILVTDETGPRWRIGAVRGARLPAQWTTAELPDALVLALQGRSTLKLVDLLQQGGHGVTPRARSGLYTPLRSRGEVVGLLAVEHREPDRFTDRDVRAMDGLAEPLALALDNARFFSRLRTVSAEAERMRIARDLHDRVGQSLAYLAFELDRVVQQAEARPTAVHDRLEQLRSDVRGVVTEVRDTLYDLRTDVTETDDFVKVMGQFLERVRERTDLDAALIHHVSGRLPLPQERELWRIAQEAVTNVERHANASALRVSWRCSTTTATLAVSDNGRGFMPGTEGRMDSYGLMGMRERAAGIGARLEIESAPHHGTTVRCTLGMES